MFSPKIPSLFVLVGDEASMEAENLVSVLMDHAEPERRPLMQVICLWENPKQRVMDHPLVHVSHYRLDQVAGVFSAVVRERRNVMMETVGENVAENIQLGKQYIAFVAKGLSVPLSVILGLRENAQLYVKASGCAFLSQLCLLAEDDPIAYNSQYRWIANPEDSHTVHPGLLAFHNVLILSKCNDRIIRNYQTQLQMEGAFAVGLLYMANGQTQAHPLYTMRYGKINGSSYDLLRIQQDMVAQRLSKWAATPITATEAWALLSTDMIHFKSVTGKESLSDVLCDELADNIPSLADLAVVGMDRKDVSIPKLILSFDQLNEESTYIHNESTTWAAQWVNDIGRVIARYPHLDSLAALLETDGAIGQTIRGAMADVNNWLSRVNSAEQWLRIQWAHMDIPAKKWTQTTEAYNLLVLREYFIAYQELCRKRGLSKRLAAMESARKRLLATARTLLRLRDEFLQQYRLSDNERTVLYALCSEYMKGVQSVAGNLEIEKLDAYMDAVRTLYDPVSYAKSWEALVAELLQKTTQDNVNSFGAAYAKNIGALQLRQNILQNNFNDAALLPQLFSDLPPEAPLTYYLVPDVVYQALPPDSEREGFVPIPGDVIERVTFVPLGDIPSLLKLSVFTEIAFDVASHTVERVTNSAEGETAPQPQPPLGKSWNINLVSAGKNWVLSWDWAGNPNQNPKEITHIVWPGNAERVTYDKWFESGKRLVLPQEKIPFGRFLLQMRCGSESCCADVSGRPLDIELKIDGTRRSRLQMPDGRMLTQIAFHLEGGDLANARENRLLLKKKNGPRTFLYELFDNFDMADITSGCVAYCEESGELSLEGNGCLFCPMDEEEMQRGDGE